MEPPALFRLVPGLAGRIPFQPLGRFPTRVERVSGLLPPSVELWVKRDDESGALYGGNKVRKLEWILPAARARGAERLCTIGGWGSHHVLATALYGAAQGFAVSAIVFPQPLTAHVIETLRAGASAGAGLRPAWGYLDLPARILAARLARRSAWVAPGGSSPSGSLGYVCGGIEIAEQVARGELPAPDLVYVALGSCGTAAGLAVGLAMAGLATEVRAVRVVDRLVTNAGATRRLARRTARLIERAARAASVITDEPPQERISVMTEEPPLRRIRAGAAPLSVEHRFFGGAYGLATPAAREAVERAAQAGLTLEPTYTGKAMAALLDDARAGRLDGKRVLFLHTFSSADLGPLLARAAPPLPPRLARLATRLLPPDVTG